MSNIVKHTDRALKIREKFTSQEFIVAYSPVALQKRFLGLPLQQAVREKIVRLFELYEAYGAQAVSTYIHSWILQLNLFLNRKEPMSDAQIEETSMLFYQKAKLLNLAELTLFFSSVKMGDYGEIAGYLDGPKILSYLSQFLTKRSIELARLTRLEEQQRLKSSFEKSNQNFVSMPEEMKSRLMRKISQMGEKSEQELQAENSKKVKQLEEKGFTTGV